MKKLQEAKALSKCLSASDELSFVVDANSKLLDKLRHHFAGKGLESGLWGVRADGHMLLEIRPANEELAAKHGIVDEVRVIVHPTEINGLKRYLRSCK